MTLPCKLSRQWKSAVTEETNTHTHGESLVFVPSVWPSCWEPDHSLSALWRDIIYPTVAFISVLCLNQIKNCERWLMTCQKKKKCILLHGVTSPAGLLLSEQNEKLMCFLWNFNLSLKIYVCRALFPPWLETLNNNSNGDSWKKRNPKHTPTGTPVNIYLTGGISMAC